MLLNAANVFHIIPREIKLFLCISWCSSRYRKINQSM